MEAAHLPETVYIPRVKDFLTKGIPSPSLPCALCTVPLGAFPDWKNRPENRPVEFERAWYHPDDCLRAAKIEHYSVRGGV